MVARREPRRPVHGGFTCSGVVQRCSAPSRSGRPSIGHGSRLQLQWAAFLFGAAITAQTKLYEGEHEGRNIYDTSSQAWKFDEWGSVLTSVFSDADAFDMLFTGSALTVSNRNSFRDLWRPR